MSDQEIQEAARKAARAGQFPLGLKGRRIRYNLPVEFFGWEEMDNGKGKWFRLEKLEAIVLEVVWETRNSDGWVLLAMLDDGRVITTRFKADECRVEIIG